MKKTISLLKHNERASRLLEEIQRIAKLGAWEFDVASREIFWTDEIYYLHDTTPEEFNPTDTFISFFTPESQVIISTAIDEAITIGKSYDLELQMHTTKGRLIDVRTTCQVTQLNGKTIKLTGAFQDITERKQFESKLKQSEERLALAMMGTQDGLWDWNLLTDNVYYSPRWKSMLGYAENEIENKFSEWERLVHPEDLDSALSNIDYFLKNKAVNYSAEFRMQHKAGHYINILSRAFLVEDSDGKITRLVGTHVDISERKLAEEEIRTLAFIDPLTQLANRRLLVDRLKRALAASARSGQIGALLFMDLDNFKTLNDTLGHHVGDELLKQVAARLSENVRQGDTVSRLGGDEFVILLEGLSEENIQAALQTKDVAEKIQRKLNQPYQLDTNLYHCTASIGANLFIGNVQPYEELLKQADIALYQSKIEGRNTIQFFNPKMQEEISNRVDLERELRKAIEQKQFVLQYQIQVNHAGRPSGAEALIRWEHPERGTISPINFIPLAEDTGLILPIGQWVLDNSCAQLKKWEQNPLTRDLILAVNVSAKQFFQSDFVEHVLTSISRHDINPSRLKLELTESMLVNNINDIVDKMQVLSKTAVRFSLDDFGTGYSSLQYLKKLPLNQLKIDKSFVHDIATNSSDRAIVRTIISMALSLDIRVIAEGVETKEQHQFLIDNGCMYFQGYFFSKPLPIDEFEALLSKS